MFDNYEFWSERTALMVAIFAIAFVASKALKEWWQCYQMEKYAKNKWREVPRGTFNENGMIMPSRASLVCSPVEKKALINNAPFPEHLAGFMAHLSPGEISTILLEIQTHTNQRGDEKQKDVRRAVTIAAAHYQFYVPHALLLLDARTHELYASFMNAMELVKTDKENVFNMGMPAPANEYITAAVVTGHVLIHFALKGNFPSLVNFAKTVNKNLPGMRKFHVDEIRCFVTAYAYVTDMVIPRHYALYNELTDALVHSGFVEKDRVVIDLKPHLTLVQ